MRRTLKYMVRSAFATGGHEGLDFGNEAPTVEVLVWREGEVIHRELYESSGAAADVVDRWNEIDGAQCSIDDLSVAHRAGQILEPSAGDGGGDERYPHASPRD